MKPLFTIHAGEYLVASHIEQHYKRVNVWVPTRDTGVDLLVSDSRSQRTVSLQVKFSKDFLYMMKPLFQDNDSLLRACGWWTINREKLRKSVADYWVFMLLGFNGRTKDFVIIPPKDLLQRLEAVHGFPAIFQTYLWVTTKKQCFETRGLSPKDSLEVARGQYNDVSRDLSQWLNNWTAVQRLNE
jgi:hypothetical protein